MLSEKKGATKKIEEEQVTKKTEEEDVMEEKKKSIREQKSTKDILKTAGLMALNLSLKHWMKLRQRSLTGPKLPNLFL